MTRVYIGVGVLLNLGIFFFMMIHEFQILFIMVYGFFFTDTEMISFKDKILGLIK